MTNRRLSDKFSLLGRRRFLAGLVASIGVATTSSAETKTESANIRAIGGNGVTRVRMEMEMKGNVHVARNPLVSREMDLQLPLASDAVFDYEERPQIFRDADGETPFMVAERYYHTAGCDSRVNKTIHQLRLRDDVRGTIVDRRELPEIVYCKENYLTRDEVDLLRQPICSLGIDAMLPAGDVQVGDSHAPSLAAVAAALNLTSAQTSTMALKVAEITDQSVKFEFQGVVVGATAGVATEIKTIGKLTFDRTTNMCSWIAIALHEKRDIGVAEPGFDLSATVKMVRQPIEKIVGLSPHIDRSIVDVDVREAQTMALIESDSLNVSAMMDRRWLSMSDVPGAAVWRMTQNDRSVAQCDLRVLPSLSKGQQWTMQDFLADIQKTLGDQVSEIVDRHEMTSPAGMQVLSVTASGIAGEVPVRWTMVHFREPGADASRRILATFTLQADQVDTFAGSDDQMAGTFRIGTQGLSATSLPENLPSGLEDRPLQSASLPRQNATGQVKSASDIR